MAQPNISSELLRTFICVVEYDGFIKAAGVLHKTQSTVSQQIKKLESEVGVELFRTLGRRRVLTHEGEMLLGYARRMLSLQDDAIASLQMSNEAGEIRIGVSPSIAESLLPELLAGFVRTNPGVRLMVDSDYSPNLLAAYDQGEYDLVLTLSVEKIANAGELLGSEPLAWIGSQGWEWSSQRELPLAAYSGSCQFKRVSTAALEAAGIPWRLVYNTSSYQALMAAVNSGLAVTVRPRSVANQGGELLGERLGLPELTNVYSWLKYRPNLEYGQLLADALRRSFSYS